MEEGANHTKVGSPGVGPMQSRRLGVQIAVECRVMLSGLAGSHTIRKLGELESLTMRLVHEAIDGA